MLSLVTAPTSEPLTLAEAKSFLRIDADDHNADVLAIAVGARAYAEQFTRRAFMPQTWDLKLDAFPCDEAIVVPMPPVTAITSVSYIDPSGAAQTWSSSLYQTDLPAGPTAQRARLLPAYGQNYPATRPQMNAVTVRFVCGYANAEAVPFPIKLALRLLIESWFDDRTQTGSGVQAADALLWPYRVW